MLSTRWRPQPTAGGDDVASTWTIPQIEWDVLLAGRAHVLLEGEKSRVRQIIFSLTPQMPRPMSWWQPGAGFPAAPHTVVVENVDALRPGDQCELFEELSRAGAGVQIISTCSKSLYAAVCRGEFLPELYYRLNLVRIEME